MSNFFESCVLFRSLVFLRSCLGLMKLYLRKLFLFTFDYIEYALPFWSLSMERIKISFEKIKFNAPSINQRNISKILKSAKIVHIVFELSDRVIYVSKQITDLLFLVLQVFGVAFHNYDLVRLKSPRPAYLVLDLSQSFQLNFTLTDGFQFFFLHLVTEFAFSHCDFNLEQFPQQFSLLILCK